jgi:exosortase/archaeosortase
MIGLLFFGAIALWALIALVLGVKLPEWLRIQRYRLACTLVFVVLVFFAPVADEVIAWPQMQVMCRDLQPLSLASGMSEEQAYGRTVSYRDITTPVSIFPSSVNVDRHDGIYFDTKTNEPILAYHGYTPRSAFLAIPNGSSGGSMTLLLQGCSGMKVGADGYTTEKYDSNGLPIRFSHLKLSNAR